MQGPFIGEEKLVFGVHAHAMSQMTISKMRKIYNKVDSKSIAKQVKLIHFSDKFLSDLFHYLSCFLCLPLQEDGGHLDCPGLVWSGLVWSRSLSCPVLSGLVWSGPVRSGPVRSGPVRSCPVLSCPVLSRQMG